MFSTSIKVFACLSTLSVEALRMDGWSTETLRGSFEDNGGSTESVPGSFDGNATAKDKGQSVDERVKTAPATPAITTFHTTRMVRKPSSTQVHSSSASSSSPFQFEVFKSSKDRNELTIYQRFPWIQRLGTIERRGFENLNLLKRENKFTNKEHSSRIRYPDMEKLLNHWFSAEGLPNQEKDYYSGALQKRLQFLTCYA